MDKREWAQKFKANHSCKGCQFVKNDVDVGVGTIVDCDHVCRMEIDEIVGYMDRFRGEGGE